MFLLNKTKLIEIYLYLILTHNDFFFTYIQYDIS